MTYTQQVILWRVCYRTSILLGALGWLLWALHPTSAVTVAGVLLGPLGTSGGVILGYESYKVDHMEDEEVITYVTRGELRKRTTGAIILVCLFTLIFIMVFAHLVLGVWT